MDAEVVVEGADTAEATSVASASREVPMCREGRDPARTFGTFTGKDAEALQRIVAEAYRQRDAERDAEFPE